MEKEQVRELRGEVEENCTSQISGRRAAWSLTTKQLLFWRLLAASKDKQTRTRDAGFPDRVLRIGTSTLALQKSPHITVAHEVELPNAPFWANIAIAWARLMVPVSVTRRRRSRRRKETRIKSRMGSTRSSSSNVEGTTGGFSRSTL